MTRAGNELQEPFLAAARGVPVMIYLVNGIRLQGAVAANDAYALLLVNNGAVQLVYKHAVSTVVPGPPIELTDAPDFA